MSNEIIFNWKFSNDKWRGPLWYTFALSVVLGLVIWWFMTKQYIMSFVIILISWVSFFLDNNSNEETIVNILPLWFQIDWNFYDYSKISSYKFFYKWTNPFLLRIYINKRWINYTDLKVDNDIVMSLKQILPNYLIESETWELTFVDKLIFLLKL